MEHEPRPTTRRGWRYALSVAVLGTLLIGALVIGALVIIGPPTPFTGGPVGTTVENPGTALHMVFDGPTPAAPVRLYFSGVDGTVGQFWSEGSGTIEEEPGRGDVPRRDPRQCAVQHL